MFNQLRGFAFELHGFTVLFSSPLSSVRFTHFIPFCSHYLWQFFSLLPEIHFQFEKSYLSVIAFVADALGALLSSPVSNNNYIYVFKFAF